MAIFQPINVYPTTKAIDVLRDNTFSAEINTNDKIIAYQLTILDWSNNVVLQDNKVDLEEPLYNNDILYFNPVLTSLSNGNDYKWRLRLYQESVSMVITSGYIVDVDNTTITITRNTNIKTGMYMRIGQENRLITEIVDTNDSYQVIVATAFSDDIMGELFSIMSDFIDTNPDYVLYARTTPSIKIENFDNEIAERHYIFKGSYSQQEYVPMIYYQWNLYIVENNVRRLIYDTGKVYKADYIFDYDGYITGNQYMIEFMVTNESGVTVTTGLKNFTVIYDTVEFLTEPQLFLDCRRHAIRINWTTPISFEPTVYNGAYVINGTVSGLAGNTMQLDTNLNINSGDMIFFNKEFYNEVTIYNPENGLLIMRYSSESSIRNGMPYVILNHGNIGNIEILRNIPYRLTNSAELANNVIKYKSDTAGYIGKTPKRANVTFQFRLPEQFWRGAFTDNMRLIPMLYMQTDDVDNADGFEVFINLNKLVYITPTQTNNVAYKLHITEIINERQIKISDAIDFDTQKYIKFIGYSDVIEIVNYDNDTKTVELFDKLPFDVYEESEFIVYNTLVYEFYTLLSHFPLQEQGTWNSTFDYIWDDKKSWDDSLYWFEGGGAQQRVANTWFKARINDKEIDIRAGGV